MFAAMAMLTGISRTNMHCQRNMNIPTPTLQIHANSAFWGCTIRCSAPTMLLAFVRREICVTQPRLQAGRCPCIPTFCHFLGHILFKTFGMHLLVSISMPHQCLLYLVPAGCKDASRRRQDNFRMRGMTAKQHGCGGKQAHGFLRRTLETSGYQGE